MVLKLDDVSARNLTHVDPRLRRVLDRYLEIGPFAIRVTEGLRTAARQRELVRIGASRTLNSRHLAHPKTGLSMAFDAVPMVDIDKDGKIEVEEMYAWPLYHRLAPAMKQAAKDVAVTVTWGGDWKSFRDGPHWELPRTVYP